MIGDFYALCERAQSIEDVAKALFETAHRTGFPHASYLCGGSPANPDAGLLLTNYPSEWRQRYLQQRYHRIDPIISRAQRTIDPFMWSDPLVRAAMTPKQLRMMEEAKTFRVGHGYAVPLHSSMQVGAACFFASEHNDIPPVSCKTMQRVSVIAHEHVCRMARLSKGRGETPQLSARERACLSLHAQGLGDAEIGRTLRLRLATVRRHLDQARLRLGVATRQEALVLALVSRQLDHRPPFAVFPIGNIAG